MSSGSLKIQLNQLYPVYVGASIEHISDIATNFVELLVEKEKGNLSLTFL